MNHDKKPIWNKTTSVWGVFSLLAIAVIGTLLVLEGNKEQPDYLALWQSVVLGIACSAVASVIYGIVQRAYTRNDEEIMSRQLEQIEGNLRQHNELYGKGIVSIHPKSNFDQEEEYWTKILQKATYRLDLIGHSISHWFRREYRESFLSKIKEIMESGNNVNIILSADPLDNVLDRVREAYFDPQIEPELSKIEKTLLYFCQFISELPEDTQQHLKIYITNLSKVTYLYIRTDKQCIISPYMHSLDDHQNSFLLEFQPGSAYAKPLEDDFEEMIGKMRPIDLLVHKEEATSKFEMRLLNHLSTENIYAGSDWDVEKTEKYIFQDQYGKYEVGYFEHYAGKQRKKSVIELPVSYGCPSRCRYCASSNINIVYPLRREQLSDVFHYVYDLKDLAEQPYVLLSMTGMGDLWFNQESVFGFLSELTAYKNLHITFSSNFWSVQLLSKATAIGEKLPIRYIQLTYVSDNVGVINQLIPISETLEHDFGIDAFIQFVSQSNEDFYRINYIVLAGINDSHDDVAHLIEKVQLVKERVTVRISRLNETNATKKNGLVATSIEKLQEIKQMISAAGISCYVFYSEKNDRMNCGQLVTELEDDKS